LAADHVVAALGQSALAGFFGSNQINFFSRAQRGSGII
jgi:hypothetical protein